MRHVSSHLVYFVNRSLLYWFKLAGLLLGQIMPPDDRTVFQYWTDSCSDATILASADAAVAFTNDHVSFWLKCYLGNRQPEACLFLCLIVINASALPGKADGHKSHFSSIFSTAVLSGWILRGSLLHSFLEHDNFFNTEGSVATCLRFRGIFCDDYYKLICRWKNFRTVSIWPHCKSTG